MPDRIADHYARHAHAFDAARSRTLIERAWLERFLRTLPRGGTILDLGCGGGEPIARFLIDHGTQLTGVDSSPGLIGLARTRFARQRWIEADMRSVNLDAAAYDGAIAWGCLFHLDHDDQVAMLARIAEWLRPGGSLLFNTGSEHGVRIGSFEGDPLFHASYSLDGYRMLLANCGFEVALHRRDDPDCGHATVWLARKAG